VIGDPKIWGRVSTSMEFDIVRSKKGALLMSVDNSDTIVRADRATRHTYIIYSSTTVDTSRSTERETS
jgi:hypothetical protein